MKKYFLLLLISCFGIQSYARNLQPGFDGNEFRKMLSISAYQVDTPWVNRWMPFPVGYELIYRSPVSGLDNRWDMWKSVDSVCVISVRGTTGTDVSWMANFYSGMIPANGKLNMGNGKVFDYQLAADSDAYVHIGWMIGLASMAPDILEKINSQYRNGIRNFILMGHSQGAAIIDLLTSYLYYEKGKKVPADVVFKTYASGAPKPGNLAFAYDFDFITRGGWAFRIVSTADWVPDVPFSIEGLSDVERGNPFANVNMVLKGAKWPVKWVAKHVVRKIERKVRKARKRFLKYLGKDCGKIVRRKIPGFPKQEYISSLNYMPCGVPIILRADAAYHQRYPDDAKNIFRHHGYTVYLYLLNQYYPVK